MAEKVYGIWLDGSGWFIEPNGVLLRSANRGEVAAYLVGAMAGLPGTTVQVIGDDGLPVLGKGTSAPPIIDDADMCPCGRGVMEFLHTDLHPPYRMTNPTAWRCKACDDEYDGRTIVQFGGPPAIGRIQLEEREPPADQ